MLNRSKVFKLLQARPTGRRFCKWSLQRGEIVEQFEMWAELEDGTQISLWLTEGEALDMINGKLNKDEQI